MRILVFGAGRTGAKVIKQLKKNPGITIVTADPREKLYAVDEGIIDGVDIRDALTPLTLDSILSKAQPDLVLVAMPFEDMGFGETPGIDILAEALHDEIAALARVPVIEVARTAR